MHAEREEGQLMTKALDNGFPTSKKIAYDPDRGFYRTDTGSALARGQSAVVLGRATQPPIEWLMAREQRDKRVGEPLRELHYLATSNLPAGLLQRADKNERRRLLARAGENVARLERGESGGRAFEEEERTFSSRASSGPMQRLNAPEASAVAGVCVVELGAQARPQPSNSSQPESQ